MITAFISTNRPSGYQKAMNEHPRDSLPAFVLGALDADEAIRVAEHLRHCPECRAEAEQFRTIVGLFPYTASNEEPPARVKRQLFARIAAAAEPDAVTAFAPSQRASVSGITPPRSASWMRFAVAFSLILVLVLSAVTVDMNRRLEIVRAEAQEQQARVAAFLASAETQGHTLTAYTYGVEGKLYAQPGHNRVIVVVQGLPPAEEGQVYQFWFATEDHQVPSEVFTVDEAGPVELVIDAPQPVDSYVEVMVTIEQDGGSDMPSDTVVLAAPL